MSDVGQLGPGRADSRSGHVRYAAHYAAARSSLSVPRATIIKTATYKQGVVVALAEVESSSGPIRSRAEVPFDVPETVGANRSVRDQAVGSAQAQQPFQPPSTEAVFRVSRTAAIRAIFGP
jgi:hypothetical protein